MASFDVNGEKEPFLIVSMDKGDKIFAESDSMLAMQDGIEIKGETRGGILASIGRAFSSDENLFQQTFFAHQDGVVMLSPSIPGDIKIFTLENNRTYYLNDYAFFAGDDSITLETEVNSNIGRAIFSGDGLFVLRAKGSGHLVINGLGSIEEIELTSDGGDLIVDNGHLLAWEDTISYKAEMVNANSSSGFFTRAFHSVTSGEGVVMRLSGNGKIYVASRNLDNFGKFINMVVQHPKCNHS